MKPEVIDAIGAIVAFVLTLMMFSYLLGDNPLYRVAMHLFVGVATGFITLVVIQTVILPHLVLGTLEAVKNATTDPLPLARLIIPILLCILLALKLSAGLASWSNIAMAFMVGVGAAVTVGGAVLGTLFGQIYASWLNPFKEPEPILAIWQMAIYVIGITLTLMYFFYSGRSLPGGRTDRPVLLKPLAWGGQFFIQTALASLYVGALAATLSVFSERMTFLFNFVINFPALLTRLWS